MVEPWLYKGKPITELDTKKWKAFVYIVESKESGLKYVGKKYTEQKRGKKWVPSKWQEYFGSGSALQKDIEKLGKEAFTRTIIRLCETRNEATYYEAYFQMKNHVLISDEYYNAFVGFKLNINSVKTVPLCEQDAFEEYS